MPYTVHEVANISGVTIKTLYHYQKIGLLLPEKIGANGYRFYGEEELKKLQQILIYRELDYPLKDIIKAMESEASPVERLKKQKQMLFERRRQIDEMIKTIDRTIREIETGETLPLDQLFIGININKESE